MYIQEVRKLVDLCNLNCNANRDKLIMNCIIAGLDSVKSYQQCISKDSSLSLTEYFKICQMEDTTWRQVQVLQPESSDCSDSTQVHKISQYSQEQDRPSFMGGGVFRSGRFNYRGGAHPWGQDYMDSPKTGGHE